MRVHRDLVEERLPHRLEVPEQQPEPAPEEQSATELPSSNAVAADSHAASRLSPAAITQLQGAVGN